MNQNLLGELPMSVLTPNNFFSRLNETIAQYLGEIASPSLQARITLETILDERTMCHKNGTLSSIIKINGAGAVLEKNNKESALEKLQMALKPILNNGPHSLEITLVRDPKRQQDNFVRTHHEILDTCQRQRLDLKGVLNGQYKNYEKNLTDEEIFLTLYTTSHQRTHQNSWEEARYSDSPKFSNCNDAFHNHQTSLDTLFRNLQAQGYLVNILNSHEYLDVIKKGLYPNASQPVFQNVLNQGRKTGFHKRLGIDRLLATETIELKDGETVCLGNNLFAGMDVSLTPETLLSFDELILAMSKSGKNISWRCTFKVYPSSAGSFRTKEQFVRLFGFTNPKSNYKIRSAFNFINDWAATNGAPIELRLSFATWTRKGEDSQLRTNAAILKKTIEQWGNTMIEPKSGDHVATIFSSIPGFGPASTASAALAPLDEALAMSPLVRNKSPWEEGNVLFTTTDGLCWPYHRGSPLLTNWLEIIVGGSGSGKSVALNAINLNSIIGSLNRNLSCLPEIAIIDVGNSSKGLIQLLQEALPLERKGEAVHIEFKMLPENAINIFDTPLGFRIPLVRHRNFLINFLSIIIGFKDTNLSTRPSRILGILIDKVFEEFSDSGSPKRYFTGGDDEIDQTLKTNGFKHNDYTSWWEIVDWLFNNGYLALATRAQIYAVPTLGDIILTAHSPQITDLYGSHNEVEKMVLPDIIKQVKLGLSEAIRDYPIIANATRFNLCEAKVVAIDIAQVLTPDLSKEGQIHAALMFMMASKVATSHWDVERTEIVSAIAHEGLPPEYQAFHFERAEQSKMSDKFLCLDEYHRASAVPEINHYILLEAREGRKRNVRISLASQFIDDFQPQLLELATTILVFGSLSRKAQSNLNKVVPLQDHIVNERGFAEGNTLGQGATLIGVFKTKLGVFQERLIFNLSPQELWEFSTTVEDVNLRHKVYHTYGVTDGREMLARRFPEGTARNKILNMRNYRLHQSNSLNAPQIYSDVVSSIVKELQCVNGSDDNGTQVVEVIEK